MQEGELADHADLVMHEEGQSERQPELYYEEADKLSINDQSCPEKVDQLRQSKRDDRQECG